MSFISCQEGDILDVFVTNQEIIDRFVGNQLWVWGRGNYGGQLGNNSTINRSSPVQTVSSGTNWQQASGNVFIGAGVKTDGTLWLWGRGAFGGLGNNLTSNLSSPVQTVSTGTNWKQVSAGSCHATAIKTDGTLWVWGGNNAGNLGINSTVNISSPVQTVSTGTNWKQVYSNGWGISAIKTDGTLWLWGCGALGQLGTNSIINHSSPVQTVSSGTNWKLVSAGSDNTVAIKTDGTLWLWGRNANGQLGNNSTLNRSSPVQTLTAGTNWKQASISNGITAGIKTDGTLWVWGSGSFLGNNSTTDRSSPVQTVSTGTNWKQVSAGGGGTAAAIKTDGTLWMWGSQLYGALGNNNTVTQSSPVQTVSSGTNWKQVQSNQFVIAVTYTEF